MSTRRFVVRASWRAWLEHELVEIDRTRRYIALAVVGPCQHQQLVDEVLEVADACQRLGSHVEDGSRIGRLRLEQRAHARDRRPELVARVGDELALAVDGDVEPLEQLVQRLGQTVELVARTRLVHPAVQIAGADRVDRPAHRVDRAQRPADDDPDQARPAARCLRPR